MCFLRVLILFMLQKVIISLQVGLNGAVFVFIFDLLEWWITVMVFEGIWVHFCPK